MQQAPIGFLAEWKALMMLVTLGITSIFGPATAKEDKFFAAPKPPGNTTAYGSTKQRISTSNLLRSSFSMSRTFDRAILLLTQDGHCAPGALGQHVPLLIRRLTLVNSICS